MGVEPWIASARNQARLKKALQDFREAVSRWELWGALGWHDIRQRYRRSVIGPFWLTLSMAIMVGTLGFLYANLFHVPVHDYLPFIALGLIIWGFISANLIDGCLVFIASEGVIRQLRVPLTVHVLRLMWRNIIILAHNMVIYVALILIFGIWPGPTIVLAVPGVLILCLTGIWASLLVGTLSARFRDIPPTVANIIQILLFLTPILWRADQLGERKFVAELNPFYHLVEIVRAPLLGNVPPLSTWLAAIGFTLAGCLVALAIFARFRERIAYWL